MEGTTTRPDGRGDTKQSLLDAAEALISEHGVAGASLRAITSRAGANVAAANYHFGSKEALVRAVLRRRLSPVNAERLRLLDEAERRAGEGPPELERLMRAFLGPVVRFGHDLPDRGRHFAQICGRAMTQPDPTLRATLIEELGEVIRRFQAAFARALPDLPREELLWRMQFMVGAMVHSVAGGQLIEAVSGGLCDPSDLDGLVDRLTRFLTPGMLAPSAAEVVS